MLRNRSSYRKTKSNDIRLLELLLCIEFGFRFFFCMPEPDCLLNPPTNCHCSMHISHALSLCVSMCVLLSTVCIVATFESHYTFDKTAHFIIKFLIQSTIDTPTIRFNNSCSYFTDSLSMPKLFEKRTTIINPAKISTQFVK